MMTSKKICILGATNIKHMTLSSLYTRELLSNGQPYDIIYVDRYNELEPTDAENRYRFQLDINREWSFAKKLMHYWKFRKYAIEIIEKNRYDFIIVWNEFTAFMFSDFLAGHYKDKYCVNIRDYNYNNVFFVQQRLKNAVKNAAFSTISSERFLDFLPKADYLFVHSYNESLLGNLEPVKEKRSNDEKIRVMFIGRMSYPESKVKTIHALGNDKRFEFWLVGAGCGEYAQLAEENGYDNIIIKDSFEPSETSKYLEYADVIFSLNRESELFSDVLLPIKLYYAIKKQVPILAYKSSYTFEYADKIGIAIGVEDKEIARVGDIIAEKYEELQQDKIRIECEKAMQEIRRTHVALMEMIHMYVLQHKNEDE